MADLNRKFNLQGLLSLVQDNQDDGYPDGDLSLEDSTFTISGVAIVDNQIRIDILFEAMQGSQKQQHQRTLRIDLDNVDPGVMTGIENQYNSIINKVLLKLPKLMNAVEV